MQRFHIPLLLAFLLLALGACQPAVDLPTPIPTAAVPTAAPPAENRPTLPPTRDLAPTATTALTATPSREPTPSPTPVIAPILSISDPVDGQNLALGQEVNVSGYVHGSPEMTIRVGLTSITGWLLAETEATMSGSAWEATLPVPSNVSGRGELHAAIVGADGEVIARDTLPVRLELGQEAPEYYLSLARPTANEIAVAGYYLFFDGRIQQPGAGQLALSIRMDDCQEEVAQYGFSVSGSSYWQGYVIMPDDIAGAACAVASLGSPGEEGWMAAQVPISVLAPDDPQAVGVLIVRPAPGRRLTGGDTIEISGMAYNAPGNEVELTLMLTGGRVIADATADVNSYGYWEVEVPLPSDIDGEMSITALIGEHDAPVAQVAEIYTVVPGSD